MHANRALLIAAGGGIGDTLLAMTVARALRPRYEGVDALVLPSHRDIALRSPQIDRVFNLEGSLPDIARRLRNERFAAAVVTWATLETALLPFLARIPIRVGQARRLYSLLFTRRVVVRSEVGDRVTHWTEMLLDYARALGCDTVDTRPVLALTTQDRHDAADLLHKHGVAAKFGLLHPTRGLAAQRSAWPTSGFIDLARELERITKIPLLVTGSPADAGIAKAIADASGGQTQSIAGETTLGSFAALAERAAFVVAMDSGPMHLAAAAGAATIGIFALQSDVPDRWRPLGPRTAVVRATYPCPPRHRKETCPDFACVRALDIDRIVAALDALQLSVPDRTA